MSIKIQSLKKGDIFYECEYGINVEYEAICDAYRAENDQGWAILGKMLSSSSSKDEVIEEPMEFYCNDKYSYCGPKLYSYPAYA